MKGRLFSPIQVGELEIRNRIELAPVFHGLATHQGLVTRELILYYGHLARGGVGLLTIGVSAVDYTYGKAHEKELNLADERVIEGLAELVEHIQACGAKASIELNHGGRVSGYGLIGRPPLAPSPIPSELQISQAKKTGRPEHLLLTEMTIDQIEMVKRQFAEAAERCLEAGFEIIMVHGAHGQLIAQFLSPSSNKRVDHYGGSLENRARFAIEVLDAIRQKVGKRLAIEFRISAEELVEGGMTLKETIEFLKMIEEKIDLLHVSSGVITSPSLALRIIPPTYLPRGSNVAYAAEIKKHFRKPVCVVGGLTMKLAEEIVEAGKADMVAMARTILADPESARKYEAGREEEIRPCIRCNECTRRTAPPRFWSIRCSVNPLLGREWEMVPFYRKARYERAVIGGGGPAGMQMALELADKGYTVTIYEKEEELGGMLRYATIPPFKQDLRDYLSWLVRAVRGRKEIEIRLSSPLTIEEIRRERPEVIILATGGEPIVPEVSRDVDWLWVGDALAHPERAGGKVLIVGAGLTGCETALYLAEKGRAVTLTDMRPLEELIEESPSLLRALLPLMEERGVRLHESTRVVAIRNGFVEAIDGGRHLLRLPFDTLVFSLGVRPKRDLLTHIRASYPCPVYLVGDCLKPGKLIDAIHSAFTVAKEI